MNFSRIRSIMASVVGLRYRELPMGVCRADLDAVLSELGARKTGEHGSPCYEVNNEYFRIGRRRLRVCTEDEMFVSLWGRKTLVDYICAKMIARSS